MRGAWELGTERILGVVRTVMQRGGALGYSEPGRGNVLVFCLASWGLRLGLLGTSGRWGLRALVEGSNRW